MTRAMRRPERLAPALAENPFRILGLTPKATAREVEREGGKLLALLAAGMDDAGGGRTPERVRWAMAELRDPKRRAFHEFFSLSGEPLPVDTGRVAALLRGVPLEWSSTPTLPKLVSFFAGDLVPTLPAWETSAEEDALREAVLQPSAPRAAPPACLDDLELGLLLELDDKGEDA